MQTNINALEFRRSDGHLISATLLKTGEKRIDLGIENVTPEGIVLSGEVEQVSLPSGIRNINDNRLISLPEEGQVHNWKKSNGNSVMVFRRSTTGQSHSEHF